jgi:hypothetical protein
MFTTHELEVENTLEKTSFCLYFLKMSHRRKSEAKMGYWESFPSQVYFWSTLFFAPPVTHCGVLAHLDFGGLDTSQHGNNSEFVISCSKN